MWAIRESKRREGSEHVGLAHRETHWHLKSRHKEGETDLDPVPGLVVDPSVIRNLQS